MEPPWDVGSTADLYPKIIKNLTQTEMFTSSKVIDNVVQGTPAVFGTDSGLPLTINSIDDAYSLICFDQDNGTTDEQMGGVDFIPSYFGLGADGTWIIDTGDWKIEFLITWHD